MGAVSTKIDRIFKILEKKPRSLSTLAKMAGMHYYTAGEYIDLIIAIQNRPKVEKITTNGTVIVRIRE